MPNEPQKSEIDKGIDIAMEWMQKRYGCAYTRQQIIDLFPLKNLLSYARGSHAER